jgi:NitT/TauT family transport system substrate-binding protein
MLRRTAALVVALAAVVWAAHPARADDALTVVGGSNPAGFFEVLGDVADGAGFYRQQHLSVTTVYAGSPSAAAQAVATGKGDICSLGIEPIIQGYEKGLRMQAFFSRDPQYEWVTAVLDDSPIKTLADFKGATLGTISLGSPSELATVATLAGAGLSRDDVSFIPIGSQAQALAALASRKVDGASFPYTALAILEVKGHLKFRYFWHPILKDIGDVAYAATPATIQTKADALRRFSRANAEAAILIRENPQLAARYFLQGAGLKPTPEALADQTRLLNLTQDQLPGIDPASPTIGALSPLGLGVYLKWLAANGFTSQVVPVSAVVTDRFIGYANTFDHRAFIAQAKRMR